MKGIHTRLEIRGVYVNSSSAVHYIIICKGAYFDCNYIEIWSHFIMELGPGATKIGIFNK